MTLEYFNRILAEHKEANDLQRTSFYVHFREPHFTNCLSMKRGVEGDRQWGEMMEGFERNNGELDITDLAFYSKELANVWVVTNQSPYHVLQNCDFDDEEYVHANTPFINGKGDFCETDGYDGVV